ncbi:MAG: class A beta-lactamase [Candidatus Eremiobacteraeota bacterium]|nr:class A beta-lactamase [Candidatus Eremiobacteraeota bacterium]
MGILRRRRFVTIATSLLAVRRLGSTAEGAENAAHALAQLETKSTGRLGVYAREIGSGRTIAYRASDSFPMCSTFKVLLVGAVLQRVDRGRERLERHIAYTKADLLDYASVTTAHVAIGMLSVGQLCEAAIVVSDNTAANLLLRTVGGPAGVTAFVRARPFHDAKTRLDRNEPALNTAIPGDVRDTTTPLRMANALALLLASRAVLSPTSSRLLERWMRACRTGTDTLRAGLPAQWAVGDKTGSGENGTRNDVAIIRPLQRDPVVAVAYLTGATGINDDGRNAILAHVGRIITAALSN